jgi:hypothetical protein
MNLHLTLQAEEEEKEEEDYYLRNRINEVI